MAASPTKNRQLAGIAGLKRLLAKLEVLLSAEPSLGEVVEYAGAHGGRVFMPCARLATLTHTTGGFSGKATIPLCGSAHAEVVVAIPALLHRLVKLTLSAIVAGVDWCGGRWPAKGTNRQNCGVVLYYHAVPRALRAAFAQQMAWIADQAAPWSLSEPLLRVPFWVGISFDDA